MSSPIKRRPVHFASEQDKETWAGIVGGMVLNHGSVEFISLMWIRHLSKDVASSEKLIDQSFSRRIEAIKKLVSSTAWPEERQQRASNLWTEALRLLQIRNRIVHNPLAVRKNVNGEAGIGIIDAKKMKGTGHFAIEPIQLFEVAEAGEDLAKLLESLRAFSLG